MAPSLVPSSVLVPAVDRRRTGPATRSYADPSARAAALAKDVAKLWWQVFPAAGPETATEHSKISQQQQQLPLAAVRSLAACAPCPSRLPLLHLHSTVRQLGRCRWTRSVWR